MVGNGAEQVRTGAEQVRTGAEQVLTGATWVRKGASGARRVQACQGIFRPRGCDWPDRLGPDGSLGRRAACEVRPKIECRTTGAKDHVNQSCLRVLVDDVVEPRAFEVIFGFAERSQGDVDEAARLRATARW
jgi:hypothetical protein